MPRDNTFMLKASDKFVSYTSNLIKQSYNNIYTYGNNILYFRKLILHYINDFYSNQVIKDLLVFDNIENINLSNKSLDLLEVMRKDISPFLNTSKNKDVLIIYVRGLQINYLEFIENKNLYNYAVKFSNLSPNVIVYFIEEYFKVVSKKLLEGDYYRFNRLDCTIKVISKKRVKTVNGKKIKKLVIDWGSSFNFLLEQSKTLDAALYESYIKGDIKKKEFINALKKYTYSKDNPNGLKWIMYSDKSSDLWLVLHKKYSNVANMHKYSVTPTNMVMTEDKSQSNFVKSCTSINDIIDTTLLGFRDKLRALENFSPEYCDVTFKKYNYDL